MGTDLDETPASAGVFDFAAESCRQAVADVVESGVSSRKPRSPHMRKLAILLALSLPAMAQPSLAQQPATTAPPSLVREGVTEKLTAHVWAIPDGSANLVPNVGIVVGKKAVLVVDTGMGTRNAETVLKEVAKVGAGKPIYLVTTHVHPEHDMGAHAFPADSKLIRSKTQVEDIATGAGMNLVPVFAARSALNVELLKDAHHRNADI